MQHEHGALAGTAGPPGTAEQPQAIWLNEAEDIVGRVHDLIRAGRVEPAWDLLRRLHPADMASILAGLPGTSRDALLRVMSPETVVWMLRQMNPAEAGRVGRRLGSHVLWSVLHEIHPQHALDTLRRLPSLRTREVIAALRRSGAEGDLLAHEPDTAGVLMADEFPAVPITTRSEQHATTCARSAMPAMGSRTSSCWGMPRNSWARSASSTWRLPATRRRFARCPRRSLRP